MGCLNKARSLPTNLSPAEYKAVKLLKKDGSIIITPVDKGNMTIMINSEDYDGKFRSLLAGTDTGLGEAYLICSGHPFKILD